MRTVAAIQLLLMALLLPAGCTTLADARDAKGTGIPRIYDAPFGTVWEAVPSAVERCGPDVVEVNKQDGYVLAVKGATLLSFGENVAVFVNEVDDKRARVEVVSKKVVEINILARNWAEPILDELSQTLRTRE
jgi:hypothetical protein